MKPVGKPDALIGHVRFDERGWETGRRSVRQCSRPSSTLLACADPDLTDGALGLAAVFLAMNITGHAGIFGCEASLFSFRP